MWAVEFFAGLLEVPGLGLERANQLIQAGLLSSLADVFGLTVEALAKLPRWSEKSGKKLVDAIAAARQRTTLARLLHGLGIPGVGPVVAKAVAQRFGKLSRLLAAPRDEIVKQLTEVEGIGDVLATAVADFFADPGARRVVERMIALGADAEEPVVAATGPLAGKAFVVTGTLSRSREEIIRRIEAAGGKVAGSVSKKTHFLVAGADVGKTKMDAAAKHGTKIISEADLEKMIG
jgi:DNA ligase (NAD+)